MRLNYWYYIFFILKTYLCVNLRIPQKNAALFLTPIHNGLININTTKNVKTKRRKIISSFKITKKKKYNYRAYANDEKNTSSHRDNNKNDDNILKKKHSEKQIEQSIIPLNIDWIKVMNLISSSNDVNTTTLAFNAALSAVEKKGCLTSIIELFEIMKKKNIKPDLISYKLILSLCDKYHLAEYAEILFDEMVESDNIRPSYEIYSIMISCFSKVGDGHKAIEFLEKLRNDPFVENIKELDSKYDKEKSNRWENTFAQVNSKNDDNKINNGEDDSPNYYNTQFKELTEKIKNVENNNNNKIQYSEYANVIFACNMSNLHEHGIKYFEELLNSTKYIPSTFIFENIFNLLGKNGNYEKALDYYNKIKDDPNFKKYINVNILNNILKSLSLSNKINIIENIWNNEYDELLLVQNSVSYQIMLNVYSNIDDYEKAFKLFKEMQMKKMLNKKNILPFVYTINSFKNCGIYNYSIYVLRIAKLIGIVGKDLLFLYNNAMISCINAKKYDVIISLYTELIALQEKDTSLTININTLSFVLLAFKELKMKEDFLNLKNIILQKNYKLTPLCSKVINEQES
ncbi:pentatricopeptide repeat domain-containing protein, putative [Plasmodium yoelii]|uniref:Pentatricopeptide repeat-containing protein 1 n=3 Tax=Plasmodium yoelii TaxID=5861 RepID=A0AAE9WSG8_PLAYO|nr:pentatricopeptide repeat domain-containing protein, putative [Plasmodium yoelii]EAA22779.1 hypothetical protein [Plasmodium yoelii yoelii]WBY58176.1 pentatricopeptide repeat-containing protein 1 [Plasmodium yoelii yoelii]CDU85212.1 conserved Plasmodium protein, unknown function [Plasmodium yoelii]VTZ79107.1 pentatricopeptide repeat domain-containing protein, putative [Plasmodium yoelii]|eukprot:XP_731214.1 pentatricopeptide repeat domain-containing protein, putative [Plasmodium yoelii]